MKTLYESILNSAGTGKTGILNYIKNENIGEYKNITFRNFLDVVTPEIMERILKRPFWEAKKSIGNQVLFFSDGILPIEIMKMGTITHGYVDNTWWREGFIPTNQMKGSLPTDNRLYMYHDYLEKLVNSGYKSFSSGWGDRLHNLAPLYLQHLKDEYEHLINVKW